MSLLSSIFGAANPASGVSGMVSDVIDHIKMTPEQKAQIQLSMEQNQTQLVELADKYNTAIISQVNATMQAEAKSEHWLQWAWRPLFGVTGAAVLAINYVLIPLFGGHLGIKPIDMPGDAWNTLLLVLGVSAGTRGYEKIIKAGKPANGGGN